MRCEVCGRKIHGDPMRAVIEGAKLTVCLECSKHGRLISREEEVMEKAKVAFQQKRPQTQAPVSMVQKKITIPQVQITQELTEDYPTKIRLAREKLALSHEDLGKKINEKASVLKNIEAGKMEPNNLLASKLERVLKITLLVKISDDKEEKQGIIPKLASRELTLGDLIELNKNSTEEPTKRK